MAVGVGCGAHENHTDGFFGGLPVGCAVNARFILLLTVILALVSLFQPRDQLLHLLKPSKTLTSVGWLDIGDKFLVN